MVKIITTPSVKADFSSPFLALPSIQTFITFPGPVKQQICVEKKKSKTFLLFVFPIAQIKKFSCTHARYVLASLNMGSVAKTFDSLQNYPSTDIFKTDIVHNVKEFVWFSQRDINQLI